MGQDVDARTDIFAVGIILWELLAGQRLFLGDTDFQTVKKVQAAQVPSISQINKKVPPELERIINKALAREPAQRYRTARELGPRALEVHVQVRRAGEHVRHRGARAGRAEGAPAPPPDAGEHHRQAHRGGAPRVHLAHRRQGRARRRGRGKPIDTSTITGPLKPPAVAGSFVDVGSWIDEIAVGQKPETRSPRLAADGRHRGQPRRARGRRRRSAVARLACPSPPSTPRPVRRRPRPRRARRPRHPEPPRPPSPPRRRTARRLGVVVALVVVMAAGAAAWFTHLIPHP